jgi:hypothetical protein
MGSAYYRNETKPAYDSTHRLNASVRCASVFERLQ